MILVLKTMGSVLDDFSILDDFWWFGFRHWKNPPKSIYLGDEVNLSTALLFWGVLRSYLWICLGVIPIEEDY